MATTAESHGEQERHDHEQRAVTVQEIPDRSHVEFLLQWAATIAAFMT
jgi:hypothetical protein